MNDNPVMRCLDKLKQLQSEVRDQVYETDELVECLEELCSLCSLEGSGNAAIATRNGAVELICLFCRQIEPGYNCTLNASLRALAPLLNGTPLFPFTSTDYFVNCFAIVYLEL